MVEITILSSMAGRGFTHGGPPDFLLLLHQFDGDIGQFKHGGNRLHQQGQRFGGHSGGLQLLAQPHGSVLIGVTHFTATITVAIGV